MPLWNYSRRPQGFPDNRGEALVLLFLFITGCLPCAWKSSSASSLPRSLRSPPTTWNWSPCDSNTGIIPIRLLCHNSNFWNSSDNSPRWASTSTGVFEVAIIKSHTSIFSKFDPDRLIRVSEFPAQCLSAAIEFRKSQPLSKSIAIAIFPNSPPSFPNTTKSFPGVNNFSISRKFLSIFMFFSFSFVFGEIVQVFTAFDREFARESLKSEIEIPNLPNLPRVRFCMDFKTFITSVYFKYHH